MSLLNRDYDDCPVRPATIFLQVIGPRSSHQERLTADKCPNKFVHRLRAFTMGFLLCNRLDLPGIQLTDAKPHPSGPGGTHTQISDPYREVVAAVDILLVITGRGA
jgi:hypothetical protein